MELLLVMEYGAAQYWIPTDCDSNFKVDKSGDYKIGAAGSGLFDEGTAGYSMQDKVPDEERSYVRIGKREGGECDT